MALKILKLGRHRKSVSKTSISSVRTWVDNLPLINTDRTVSQLEAALEEISRFNIPATERLAALELLNAPVIHATGTLKKGILGKQFPLRQKDLEKAGKATALYHHMALGYKTLVPLLQKRSEVKTGLVTAIHRAIRYLSEVLIGNFQIYVQYPDGVWKDLHSLYATAERHGLLHLHVTDVTLHKPESTTIEDVYKQILLLSLACPYRLRQSEISNVYALLYQWAPYSKLSRMTAADSSGFFACNLDSDDPPGYLQQQAGEEHGEKWRIFDTAGMGEPVRVAIEAREKAPKHYLDHLEDRILQRLMMSWGVMPKRQFTRHQQHATIDMVLGINAIHHVISGHPPQEQDDEHVQTEVIRDREYLQDPTFERPTRINMHRHATGKGQSWSDNRLRGAYAAGGHAPGKQQDSLHIEHWKMQDMSAGGYCLLWDSDEPSSAHVGELVAIRTNDEHWNLGVIRWMKFTAWRGLGLGIQMLSPGASAIWASICSEKAGSENRMQGILLPDIKGLNQEATLLLPPLPFRTGSLSRLTREGNEERIRLTRQLEDTGSFAQFHFMTEGKS